MQLVVQSKQSTESLDAASPKSRVKAEVSRGDLIEDIGM